MIRKKISLYESSLASFDIEPDKSMLGCPSCNSIKLELVWYQDKGTVAACQNCGAETKVVIRETPL